MNDTATPVMEPGTDMEADIDRAALIAHMVSQAKSVPEPGDLHPGDVLHQGDADYPAPVVAGSVKSAGYVWVYDTKTGDPSRTNRNMLLTQLKKTHPDGTLAFDTVQRVKPKLGKLKCLLHPDDPNRPRYDEVGFTTCTKHNLMNKHLQNLHMSHRHKDEWAAIQEERKDAEKEADRKFQREMLRKQIKASKA